MKEPLALRIQQELLQTLREYSKNQGVDVTTLVEDYTRSLVDDNNCVNAVYVLELEDGKWYVGQTSNLEQRMTQHFSGNGAQWTKLHKPMSIKETRLLLPDENPLAEERTVTKQYMEEYGFDNVRGSLWCKVDYETEPDWNKLKLQKPGNKKAISLRIDVELLQLLEDYCYKNRLTKTEVIENLIRTNLGSSTLDLDKVVDSTPSESSNSYMTEDTRQSITEEFILQTLLPLKSRIEQLEEAIDYYDKALMSLIEEPALLNLFKDEQTQEQLILFIERLKDTNASKTISIIPEVLGSRS